jgi:hypothetical protein
MKLFLVSCSAMLTICSMAQIADKPTGSPQDVSYCELAKDPAAFIGKRIRIRVIYRYAFEIERLEPPVCCPDNGPKIWVNIEPNLEGRSRKLFRKLNKGQGVALVVFIGKFEGGEVYGTFADRFQLSVEEIERVEHTSRSSRRQDDPEWVPRNCKKSDATPAPTP